MNQRTDLLNKVKLVIDEFNSDDLWEASAKLSEGKYKYLLHLYYESRYDELKKELKRLLITTIS